MDFDVVVVGGGTSGCVLAARLSENSDRRICLLEAGPDYGPLVDGHWPQDLLHAGWLASTHVWEPGGEDNRILGGRVLGGSSAVNACMVVAGSPADYDEWGHGWSYETLLPYLRRAMLELRTAPANTHRPVSFHVAFLEAAQAAGFSLLEDPSDPAAAVGVAPFPANVVDGVRWNAAFAYLDPARGRPNLTIVPDTVVDRVELDAGRAVGVTAADGRRFPAETVVLAAGAYFTPAILMRSGIGPEAELEALGIPVVSDLPTGSPLLDHCGTTIAWSASDELQAEAREQAEGGDGLFQPHAVLKAASSLCPEGTWDLHLVSWIYRADEGGYEAGASVFHMKPLSTGRIRLRSLDPFETPVVERGFLRRDEDVVTILEGIDLARRLAAEPPLAELLGGELRPGSEDSEQYLRRNVRNYFHPAGTCGIGAVVDAECRVYGVEGLLVADASVMPTIPRANTNLTTAAIAERVAEALRD